ncbi:MAG: hypothetical protein ACRDJW_00620 [Thermomicrobiales bacterium]
MTEPPPPPESAPSPAAPPEESTVGTGTFFALGCTVATLLIVLLGIAVFVLFVD